MDKYLVTGGQKICGELQVSGAKNVAMKVILCGLLTDEPLYIKNVPLISSVYGTAEIVNHLGVKTKIKSDHTMKIQGNGGKNFQVPLELGGLYRTATMVMGPLLARHGKAVVPNPGGCRLGKRPIDLHVEGLRKMGAKIKYEDGFFWAETEGLIGTKYKFSKNTHTGTETLILAAVLAKGETILENAAQEPEIDNLILLLRQMGAKIRRLGRTIYISGVKKLKGAHFEIMPDRNEVVTFAISALATFGDIVIRGTQRQYLRAFLGKLDEAGGFWEPLNEETTRFWRRKGLRATFVTTAPFPGFMTDWQAPWALLMTQAKGVSAIRETIFEDRFGYVFELQKMGAKIKFLRRDQKIHDEYCHFKLQDKNKNKSHFQSINIFGPTKLHNAILEVTDLRAGATLVLAALTATDQSVIFGIEHIDRGYEKFDERLQNLGAKIQRVKV